MMIRTLSAGSRQFVPHSGRGVTDLKYLDAMREQMRRDCARHLAERLIVDGLVSFDESMEYDPRFGANFVHMRADLKVAA